MFPTTRGVKRPRLTFTLAYRSMWRRWFFYLENKTIIKNEKYYMDKIKANIVESNYLPLLFFEDVS